MKKIISAIMTLILVSSAIAPSLAIPIGSDIEYIPAPRNLGVNVIAPLAKLDVNGQVLIRGGTPAAGQVLTSNAIGLATWEPVVATSISNVSNTTINNNTVNGDVTFNKNGSLFNATLNGTTTIVGKVVFKNNTKIEPFSVNGALTVKNLIATNDVTANRFFGGSFFGNGAGLTKINAASITGIVNNASIDPNFRPSALKAPDGSPNPALSVDNSGNVTIGTNLTVTGTSSVKAIIDTRAPYYGYSLDMTGVTGGWARSFNFTDNGTNLGGFGGYGYGLTDNLNYLYINAQSNVHTNPAIAIPPTNNVGMGTTSPTEKLHVVGNVKATKFIGDGSMLTGINPTVVNNSTVNNSTFNNSTINNSIVNGTVSFNKNGSLFNTTLKGTTTINGKLLFTSNTKVEPFSVDGALTVKNLIATNDVTANRFFGGSFFGNGAGLTKINAASITGIINNASIDPNFRPSALKAPDGSPNPALSVDNSGNIGIATSTPAAKLHVAGEAIVGNTGLVCSATTEGAIRYNSIAKSMEFCNASAWTLFTTPGYSWNLGTYGACNASCGGGTQTRTVTCVNTANQVIADSYCTTNVGPKPATTQACNTQSCANWHQANAQNCPTFCTSLGKTNVQDPQGYRCVSGEDKSAAAVGIITYTYGTWPDASASPPHETQSYGNYCYQTSNQPHDGDATDITTGCYCQ